MGEAVEDSQLVNNKEIRLNIVVTMPPLPPSLERSARVMLQCSWNLKARICRK